MRLPAALAIALVALTDATASAGDLTGRASVIDGDTLEINGQRIRLFGVDAPDREQTCGAHAYSSCGEAAFLLLDGSVADDEIACEERGRDQTGTILAVCHLAHIDLGAMIVKAGWALANREETLDYADEEEDAKAAKRGMWRDEFIPPSEWRDIMDRRNERSG